MPELPEVETVRRGLSEWTLGHTIEGGKVLLRRSLAHPCVEAFWQGVTGAEIAHWQRRGKYLLAKLERGNHEAGWLGVHLRMTGQLLWVLPTEPLQKHTRVRLFLGEHELRFIDMRTFGQVWWVSPGQEPTEVITGLRQLGPEPFSSEFSPAYLLGKLKSSQRSIKTALLDQRVVAGLGNIYADESLFKSGIRPTAIASQLSQAQGERLHLAIIDVLQTAIAQGGTTFSHFRNLLGVNGNYIGIAWVYGRKGEPCRVCGTPIERLKLGGRSAHFCPQCQHE